MDRREHGSFARGRPEPVRVELLGGFRCSVGAKTVGEDAWRLKKAASLVKLLALAPGRRLHREKVMDLLWPDLSPKAAANNLRQALHVARRTVGSVPDAASRYLRLHDEVLVLFPDEDVWVDAEAFGEAAAAARGGDDPAAYRTALDLYAGELLPGDRYEAWVEGRRAELRWDFLSLLTGLAELHERRGDHDPAVEALRRAVAEEPTHEEAHAGLVRVYALQGRHSDALKQFDKLVETLSRELGTEPSASLLVLKEEIAKGEFPGAQKRRDERPPEEQAVGGPHNLPAPRTSFVGRQSALVEVGRGLAVTRLLTLTGPGGAGKTRLALKAAGDLAREYRDGAWFVELAPLSEENLVSQAVAQALGIREQPGRALDETLTDALRDKETLLVLDNCEHLVQASARLVDALLDSCPRLRVLATSREALGVEGEFVWQVPALSVPDPYPIPTAESLEDFESARLFAERARQRKQTFALTSSNAPAVATVCRRLEGIPLAIELAAARVGTLTVEQVAERLENSLALLTGGLRTAARRQRTMRATLEWSHELLGEDESRLFERLSVFAGGWKLEAAEAVCSGGGLDKSEVMQTLSNLAGKSLILAEETVDLEVRYRMLEPVRQFGRERLEAGGEVERFRERHARYFLAVSEAAETELAGDRQAEILEQLSVEYGNLSAALSWTLVGEDARTGERAELGLRLAASLWLYWDIRGLGEEGRRWLEVAVESSGAGSTARVKALNGLGWITIYRGDYGRAVALLEEGLALSRAVGDGSGAAISLAYLGRAHIHRGDREGTLAARDEAERLRREPLDKKALAELLSFAAMVALSERDHDRMETLFEESLAAFREAKDARGITRCTVSLGLAAVVRGDYDRAVAQMTESLIRLRELKDRTGMAYILLGLAGVASFRGEPERAARLWGAAEALRDAIGLSLSTLDRSHYGYDDRLSVARADLGDEAFAAAWSEGRAMTFDEVYEYALAADARSELKARGRGQPPEDPTQGVGNLTRREREVAVLVARELTNRQVASELVISERTVATHVHKILDKLGLRSRTQIPAWAKEQQLLP